MLSIWWAACPLHAFFGLPAQNFALFSYSSIPICQLQLCSAKHSILLQLRYFQHVTVLSKFARSLWLGIDILPRSVLFTVKVLTFSSFRKLQSFNIALNRAKEDEISRLFIQWMLKLPKACNMTTHNIKIHRFFHLFLFLCSQMKIVCINSKG